MNLFRGRFVFQLFPCAMKHYVQSCLSFILALTYPLLLFFIVIIIVHILLFIFLPIKRIYTGLKSHRRIFKHQSNAYEPNTSL